MGVCASIQFKFAGVKKMYLTINKEHVIDRVGERFEKTFSNPYQCLRFLADKLKESRLVEVYNKTPAYGSAIVYFENIQGFYMMTMGTKYNRDEIMLMTVLYRDFNDRSYNGKARKVRCKPTDYCFVLPEDASKPLICGPDKRVFIIGDDMGKERFA